jgi:hypothetical protein
MRLALGFGGAALENTAAKLKLSGRSVGFSAAFGGAITPNLILYGELVAHFVSEYQFENNGYSANSQNTLNVVGAGPGVAYYFMPLNLYLSGTFLLQKAAESNPNDNDRSSDITNQGVGCSLMVGKEWWVSTDWGLGIGVEFFLGSAKSNDYDSSWTSKAATVMFSATYN